MVSTGTKNKIDGGKYMSLTETEKEIIIAVRESARKGKDVEIRTNKNGKHKVIQLTKETIVG